MVTETIKYIGVNDHEVDLFEGQYEVPLGMSYNSYVILDEKCAVMDTVDRHFTKEWLDNLTAALEGRSVDYLVVHHMEPDHSASITALTDRYPDMVVVASKQAFAMMKSFYGNDYADRRVIVGEGDTLSLGEHTLRFLFQKIHPGSLCCGYCTHPQRLRQQKGRGNHAPYPGTHRSAHRSPGD